jgi:hypothetical protein
MAMRPRAAEIKAMTALLEAEHPDVESLAKQALTLAWELAEQRDRYCLIFDQPGVGVAVYGPGTTRNEVTKAIGKQVIAAGPQPARALILRMTSLSEEQ